MNKDLHKYKLTTLACFVGIFIQALASNITAILFIPFMTLYGLTYSQLGLLVGIFFVAQLLVDILFSKAIDKYGFKAFVVPASILTFAGLLLFAASPILFDNVYIGLAISTVIFACACGTLEIVLSPIVDAIPNDNKGAAMTLMHSFYAWGQVSTIIITTFLLFFLGIERWQYIILFWSIIPIISFIMFMKSKYPPVVQVEGRMGMKSLFKHGFFIIAMLAIFFGAATELTMNQWASSFTEKVLNLPKVSGDLLGMCGFAVMLGIGRTLHGSKLGNKVDLNNTLIISSALAVLAYIVVALSPINAINIVMCALCGLFASLLWPGTLVIAAEKFPMSGSFLFAMMAAAGDLGGSIGPSLTGKITDLIIASGISFANINITSEQLAMRGAILIAAVFPLGAMLCHIYLKKHKS